MMGKSKIVAEDHLLQSWKNLLLTRGLRSHPSTQKNQRFQALAAERGAQVAVSLLSSSKKLPVHPLFLVLLSE
jgi:hypothetical protein